jgi:hypothetical protein
MDLLLPRLLSSFAISSIQASNDLRSLKSSSLITVTVQTSIDLSPATLNVLPLNGTSILAIVDAGKFAALQRYLNVSASHPGIADGNVVNSTSNRLGLAPPPAKVLLNCEIVLSRHF